MRQASHRKIRITHPSTEPMGRVSRRGAIRQVKGLLDQNPTHSEAQRLIDLFGLASEELAEAGVPYETLKVVASLHPLMQ